MELPESVRAEWRETHCLGLVSTVWIGAHADAGDLHPVVTAVALLRAEGQGASCVSSGLSSWCWDRRIAIIPPM